ncbi:4-phosphoerythronate dehydrogenase [Halopseudomonas xinjiangensis]|uniref:Erythronate-4-phosphate dehydrogenase n=1 Tax=Halopseudomonas xinjiangensis TaxID=487184 RepID=A0A1H1SNQ2_9GAMM|nr:4-phosphoerythronate dehydrogenase PdxB [Halopseudomonas xinjiangensis]SDS49468.1 4-phosphoerythronate dehydrogenase [Halopseudomonas xinjiangensis]
MHIVADENIPLVDAFFSDLGRITRLPGRRIDGHALQDADVLLVRSVTPVAAATLAGTPVRFVGTCTIGTDHLDLAGLAAAGIKTASAPGCNARGVVEYVLSCLLVLSERTGRDWRKLTVGVVGVGEVGGRLVATLEALDVHVLRCDPPRAEQAEQGFVSLDELIDQADVISLHVPLEVTGRHATRHLLDTARLDRLRPGAWLINSSRGPVVDNLALRQVLEARGDLQVVLDVWEHEPDVDIDLAVRCVLATPHIAGYSLDGKLRGTEQIYRELCSFLGRSADKTLAELSPSQGVGTLLLDSATPPEWVVAKALRYVYDVRDDDARFRSMLVAATGVTQRKEGFDRLRKEYPLRRECQWLAVGLADADGQPGTGTRTGQCERMLKAAGFSGARRHDLRG